MNMKKKISWITPDYYLDVDLPIVNKLNRTFNIKWIIVINRNSSIDYKIFIEKNIKDTNINLEFIKLNCSSFSPLIWKSYYNIIKKAKDFNPDIYYLSLYGMPHALFFYKYLLPVSKCIAACHNVTTPKGAKHENIAKIYTYFWLSHFKNIQVFSKGQYDKLIASYPEKNILMAPLAIKDYGNPSKEFDKMELRPIRFLFFGNILEYKRIDLLINAVNKLIENGYRNFKVRIAGVCKEWSKYQSLIKYPEYFELQIKRIPNEDVADLFADSHYFIMPYQDIAQSGAITVAFRYNLPTITSNIEQFKEFIKDQFTGLTFISESSEDLANTMQYVIDNHTNIYQDLCTNQQNFVQKEFSIESIVKKYTEYFNSL